MGEEAEKGKGVSGSVGRQARAMADEYDQNTSHACMKKTYLKPILHFFHYIIYCMCVYHSIIYFCKTTFGTLIGGNVLTSHGINKACRKKADMC